MATITLVSWGAIHAWKTPNSSHTFVKLRTRFVKSPLMVWVPLIFMKNCHLRPHIFKSPPTFLGYLSKHPTKKKGQMKGLKNLLIKILIVQRPLMVKALKKIKNPPCPKANKSIISSFKDLWRLLEISCALEEIIWTPIPLRISKTIFIALILCYSLEDSF